MQPLSLNELRDALAVRYDSTDYSVSRLPSPSLIQELCGSFISLDQSVRGTDENPIVKLSHKSVQDLFSSRPDEIGVAEHLRKYFVSRQDGLLEMGRICLAYLRYKRYLTPGGLPEDFEGNPEHAFLRYAAVFWFQHLNDYNTPTPDLRAEVRAFLRSPSVWACVRVQSRVARYLFARYVRSPTRGYKIRIQGSGWGMGDHIPTTIPVWMDEGNETGDLELVREFHHFMLEWSESLASGRDALLQCPMSASGVEQFPGRIKSTDKCIKRANIGLQIPARDLELLVDEVYTEKGVFKARLFHRVKGNPQEVNWAIIAPFSKQPGPSGLLRLPDPMVPHTFGHFLPGAVPSLTGVFGIEGRKPEASIVTGEGTKSFGPPHDIAKIISQVATPNNHWYIKSQVRRLGTKFTDGIVVLHLGLAIHHPRTEEDIKDIEDSSESSDSDSDLDSDSGPDDYDEEEEDEEEDEEDEEPSSRSGEESTKVGSSSGESAPDDETCETPRDVALILTQKGSPIWIPQCSTTTRRNQPTGAFHPTKNIFVWAIKPLELCVIDTSTGILSKFALPEAPNESPSVPSSSATVRGEPLYFKR